MRHARMGGRSPATPRTRIAAFVRDAPLAADRSVRDAPAPRARGDRRGRASGALASNDEGPPFRTALSLLIKRRRPTLPGPFGPSTIGAERLNFSVRNGKRCFPLAIATERLRDRPLPGPQNRTAEPQSPPEATNIVVSGGDKNWVKKSVKPSSN